MRRIYPSIIVAAIIALGAILSMWIFGHSLMHRNDAPKTVTVKGMASRDFTSDLIIWRSTINYSTRDPQEGFRQVGSQMQTFVDFLHSYGVTDSTIMTSPITYRKDIANEWDEGSRRFVDIDKGFIVSQTITINSSDIEKVEKAYRKVGDLLKEGVLADIMDPQYYYTKLGDLKLKMLAEASADARDRAEQITESSKARLGSLKRSSMGVFQILGRNTNEEYSWGGTYNTTEKEKTATITVTSTFLLD